MKQKLLIFIAFNFGLLISSHAQAYPELIPVAGGTFKMGDEHSFNKRRESPVHKVTLKSFSIAKTETTVLQWKTFCDATGRKMPEEPEWGWIDNHPMVNVTWNDAVAYANWLSDKTGKIYRLPTEAEWEYAARGGSQSKGYKYSGGQILENVGWYNANSNQRTQAVAKKRANELGVYDMSGNVMEWCLDYYSADSVVAKTTLKGKTESHRMFRGGNWADPANYCRVGLRLNRTPDDRFIFIGFRLVSPE
jgi:formylglycine-generating enzyme